MTEPLTGFGARIRVGDGVEEKECVAQVNNCHANEKETKKLLKLFPGMPLIRV